jgi:hypothetical protein
MAASLNQSATARQDPDNNDSPGPEVLNRGPVHEAFANPITYDPTPGPVVPKQPPDPVEEQPPDEKPEGDDVQWIPGYWAWDEERTDFIWISGIWRVPPPNCQWRPGYWDQCEEGSGGWRWTSGCWTPLDQDSGQYLPTPPASIEQGPSSPAPTGDGNYIWNPGYWTWNEPTAVAVARYVWRPGCWILHNPDWLWVPPRYISTACGYLFVQGYWDYPIERRGILYAPIYCAPTLLPNFAYRPSVCIATSEITSCLFVQPGCQRYCFGDYFDEGYSSSGIYPWYAFHNSRYGWDPIYSYCAAAHFRDRNWSELLHEEYCYRRKYPVARPPRTYKEAVMAHNRSVGRGKFSNLSLTMPPHQLSNHGKSSPRMTPVNANQRQVLANSSKRMNQSGLHRRTEELKAAKQPQRNPSQPVHVKLPSSPIASRSGHVSGPQAGQVSGPHTGQAPGSPSRRVTGSQGRHPNALPSRSTPPPHPTHPPVDHRVQRPGPQYKPNRPEPHHNLPPTEHRSPGHPQYGAPGAQQRQQPPHTVSRTGLHASPSGTARHRAGSR